MSINLITGRKAGVPECALRGCKRIGVLRCAIVDTVSVHSMATPEIVISDAYCCKTHMLHHLSKIKMPRYSKKRVQRLAGTLPLKQVPSGVKIMEQKRETPKS